ncbi:MAG TPA: hypothetical protein VE843_08205 [Ktedonobacteraceae bacterium]|nr:hypothetical protein [Ktedonobacteraceae bacterium]
MQLPAEHVDPNPFPVGAEVLIGCNAADVVLICVVLLLPAPFTLGSGRQMGII